MITVKHLLLFSLRNKLGYGLKQYLSVKSFRDSIINHFCSANCILFFLNIAAKTNAQICISKNLDYYRFFSKEKKEFARSKP